MLNLACVGPGSFSFGMADDTVVSSTHKLGRVGKRMHEAAVAPASDGDVVGDAHVAVGSVHYMQDVLDVDAPCSSCTRIPLDSINLETSHALRGSWLRDASSSP